MECVHWDVTGISSRPLLGVLISLPSILLRIRNNLKVLVPFSGFLYLYSGDFDISDYLDEFSSPSRGSYISTVNKKYIKGGCVGSRPLLGVLISLLDLDNYGTLYVGSRPLLGVLISLRFTEITLKN